ncbi:Glycosyltransferase 2-like domain-containing protein [Gammaproteobacteria bacterium]
MVVPVYNVEPYVATCLLSILANAVDVSLELIVIDDGSRDGSVATIKNLMASGTWPETLLLCQENRGLSAVRNLGVRLARGDYIGFLDSDDFILTGGLRQMLQYARDRDCDMVLGRSRVFDSQTQIDTPFYDQAFWDQLLEGQSRRTLEARQSPAVLSLEPNANYRLIRRQFLMDHRLEFPEGLLFEDPPVHFQALLKANRIGLLDIPYYWYRVNRPGKITDEKSQRRFDVLKVATRAIEDLKACNATADQGGAALRVLFRLVWWCGTMTPLDQRRTFFSEACQCFSSVIPRSWVSRYLAQNRQDLRHSVLGMLLSSGKGASILVHLSFGRQPLLPLGGFMIRQGYMGILARSAWLHGWNKLIQSIH